MAGRRRTYRQTCTHTGCQAHRDIEYTARHELDTVSKTWKCRKHDKPDEHLSPTNRERTTILELHPKYMTGRQYTYDGYTNERKLLDYFWGPEGDPDKAHHGIVSGPGFWTDAKNFPPGTRLTVSVRIELPETDKEA
ncbi:hypothetical protein [Streptomyces bluensis]|uniref:Uncharacterized protein n=1 Tax=Streptomyces bluensis TaxID=33897 RepID=A0ABW6UU21_9ACTN